MVRCFEISYKNASDQILQNDIIVIVEDDSIARVKRISGVICIENDEIPSVSNLDVTRDVDANGVVIAKSLGRIMREKNTSIVDEEFSVAAGVLMADRGVMVSIPFFF